MKMFNWLKKATDPTPEQEMGLTAAQAAFHEANAAEQEAIAEFDRDPSTKNETALATARAEVARAREHVGRAERLLAAARARDAEADRAALLERRGEQEFLTLALRKKCSETLPEKQARALIEVVKVQCERVAADAELARAENALAAIRFELGEGATVAALNPRRFDDSTSQPFKALDLARELVQQSADESFRNVGVNFLGRFR